MHKYAQLVLDSNRRRDDEPLTRAASYCYGVKWSDRSCTWSVRERVHRDLLSVDGLLPLHLGWSRRPAFLLDQSCTSSAAWLQRIHSRIEEQLARLASAGRRSPYEERLKRLALADARVSAQQKSAVTLAAGTQKVTEPSSVTIQLPDHAARCIREALERDEDFVLVSKFNIDFCVRDLYTLQSSNWLNDEVINFYLQMLAHRAEGRPVGESRDAMPSIYVFSSFFYPKLRDRGYEAVRTSTRRLKTSLLSGSSIDKVLFPIHLGMHWCLAAVDFTRRKISYYDSLHGRGGSECISVIREWIAAESLDKLGVDFDFQGWSQEAPKDIPAQQNGHDCGVFALAYAEHLSRNAPFAFSQRNMPYWRQRISFEILQGELLAL